jgi:PAS domain S-box-containing protein
MESITSLEALKKRAQDLLHSDTHPHVKSHTNSEVSKLIDELTLYQIELEVQNEDLIKSHLELEVVYAKYTNLFELAPIGYLVLDANGSIKEINNAGAFLLGIKQLSLINQNFTRYVAFDWQLIYANYCQFLKDTLAVHKCEMKLFKKNSALFHAIIEGRAIINPNNGEKDLIITLTDINHRKQAEDSIAELNSTVIHELNHPLGAISNYIHGCIRRLEESNCDPEKLLYAMKAASKQLTRATDIILYMKNFKCKGNLCFESVDIDILLQETLALIQSEISNFSVVISYRPIKPAMIIHLDKMHIQQVVLNLIRNAIEAMKDASSPNPQLIIEANQLSKDFMELHIIDNGPGFPPDSSAQLFDLNFSTKNYGIGLGLAISRSITEAHGGTLTAKLNPTYGACFTLALPTANKEGIE